MSLELLQKVLIAKTAAARPSRKQREAAGAITAAEVQRGVADAESFVYAKALAAHPELSGKLRPDGAVSRDEATVVREFQKSHGLKETGDLKDLRTITEILKQRGQELLARTREADSLNAYRAKLVRQAQEELERQKRELAPLQPALSGSTREAEAAPAAPKEAELKEQQRIEAERVLAKLRASRKANERTNFVTVSTGVDVHPARVYIALAAYEKALQRSLRSGSTALSVISDDYRQAKTEFLQNFKNVRPSDRNDVLEHYGSELLGRIRIATAEKEYKSIYSKEQREQISGTLLTNDERLGYQRLAARLTKDNVVSGLLKRMFRRDKTPFSELD